jgi:agmatinase/guanidinopropionase
MRQPASRDLKGVDVAVVGIPFDSGAISYRSGTRFGPRKIRESSLLMWGYNSALQIAPLQTLKLVDYGDVGVEPADTQATMDKIVTEIGAVLAAVPIVIALGGDHSITLPLLRAHAERFGPLAVVHFDAHSDTWGGEVNHGNSFRFAVQEGLIDTRAFIQVGIRGPVCGVEDVQAPRDLGARVLTFDECLEVGIPAVVRLIRERVGERRAYVSLDIDAVDPAYAPGVGTPEVGGFTSYQMLQLVRGLLGLNLVGFDLVEVTPPYDPADITSVLAANLVFEFLSLAARKKSQTPA